MVDKATKNTHKFQTEVQQLLHLMVHSLYSHKEIFLRELISNSSDACDKLRFQAITNPELLDSEDPLRIRISLNEKKRELSVTDNGIGMTLDEVVENIGTIARSGTRDFVEAMEQEKRSEAQLIGQFGVGFYSVFMVSESVVLETRKAGSSLDEGVRWTSSGDGTYQIEQISRPERGTSITLKLRKSEKEFLEPYRLRTIIGKYSDHVSLPIEMENESDDKDKDTQWQAVNKGTALWSRPKSELNEEDYNSFYSSMTYDPEPPLRVLHNRVEGRLEYHSLLFIPSKAPFDLWDRDRRHGVKLYVRRVFIADDAERLMPAYLRFVRGVVDCSDLPLNVSREFLQQSKQIDQIRSATVKKILAELKKMASKKPDDYRTFWAQYGKVIKEGIIEDNDNRKTLAELLRFKTTSSDSEDQTVALADYLARMPAEQKAIYYITADSPAAAAASPHLEVFKKHNIEVLLLGDPVDEWLVAHLTEYQEKPLKSASKGDLSDEELLSGAEKDKENVELTSTLTEKLKSLLNNQVKDVKISRRLTDSPACLIADENEMGGNLERILKAMGQDAPTSKPILEVNPDHPLIRNLSPDSEDIEDWAFVLFDQAALSEGAPLNEPALYVKRVNRLISRLAES